MSYAVFIRMKSNPSFLLESKSAFTLGLKTHAHLQSRPYTLSLTSLTLTRSDSQWCNAQRCIPTAWRLRVWFLRLQSSFLSRSFHFSVSFTAQSNVKETGTLNVKKLAEYLLHLKKNQPYQIRKDTEWNPKNAFNGDGIIHFFQFGAKWCYCQKLIQMPLLSRFKTCPVGQWDKDDSFPPFFILHKYQP